jgi:hypothetical protein
LKATTPTLNRATTTSKSPAARRRAFDIEQEGQLKGSNPHEEGVSHFYADEIIKN